MSIDLVVKIDTSQAVPAVDKLDDGLQGVATSATKAGAAGKAAGKDIADGMGTASSGTKKTGDEFEALANRQRSMLERIKAPWREYSADINSAMTLLRQGKITTEEYGTELARLQSKRDAFVRGSMTPELQREAAALERINAPMREYEANVAALNSLLQKGEIELGVYNRELERVQDKQSKGLGPVLGPVQQQAGGGGTEGERGIGAQIGGVLAGQLGPAGSIVNSVTEGGALMFAGITAGAIALGRELMNLSDGWSLLQNRVMRFTEDGHSANEILANQAVLSGELHASLESTVGLYTKFREVTYELNLGQARQAVLTKEIGEAVVGSGGSVEEATGLVQRLSLAFSSGAVQQRELRSVMKEFPEIATGFTEATGKSRQELLALASKGELASETLLGTFDNMSQKMGQRVGKLNRTWSEMFGHFADEAKIAFSDATEAAGKFLAGPVMAKQITDFETSYRLLQRQAEVERRISQERERVSRLAPVAEAGNALGINIGAFSSEQVNALDAVRIRMSEVGIVIADSFKDARSRATLYATKIDEIKDSKAAEEIAADAKRIYEAMYGADTAVRDQTRHWAELSDQVRLTAGVVDKLNFKSGILGGVGDAFKFGGLPPEQLAQMRRDAALQAADAKTAVDDHRYGASTVTYAQDLNKAKTELEALNRAHRDGVVTGEAFRTKYDSLMTTINDGLLPSMIKLREEINLPMRQFALDTAAANALLKDGTYTLQQYQIEMQKLADTAGQGASWKERQGIQDLLDGRQATVGKYLHGFNPAQESRIDAIDKSSGAPIDDYIKRLNDINAATAKLKLSTEVVATLQDQAREQFDSSAAAVTRATVAIAGYRERLAQLGAQHSQGALSDEQYQSSVAALDRERAILAEYAQPAANYKRALEDIAGAQKDLGLTEDSASVRRRKAKDDYNAATEALQKQKGPLQEYEAALRKINTAERDQEVSESKAETQREKARITYLQATEAGETFAGSFEIQIRQLNESTKEFGATFAKLAVDDIGKFSDALVDAANGGKISFSSLASSMLSDLEKIAARALEVKAITSLFGAIGGGSGGAEADAFSTATSWLPGFATGGSWTVGGSGSGDTQLQMFRATPGEQVTVTPASAYVSGGAGGSQPTARTAQPVIHIHNHIDPATTIAALDSRQGSKTVVNQMRANRGAVRSFLGIRG